MDLLRPPATDFRLDTDGPAAMTQNPDRRCRRQGHPFGLITPLHEGLSVTDEDPVNKTVNKLVSTLLFETGYSQAPAWPIGAYTTLAPSSEAGRAV